MVNQALLQPLQITISLKAQQESASLQCLVLILGPYYKSKL